MLAPLSGAIMLVFLIACANVSGLLLARGFERQQEYAMRSALGAPRWRLIRQVLAESLMLAVASAVAGAALAWAIIETLEAIAGHAIPRLDAVGIGMPLVSFAITATVVAALASGVLPALRTSPSRQVPLSGARGSVGRAERRWLGAVATVQVVLTVALLAGAALLVRSARNLDEVRPGFETDRVLAMTVTAMPPNPWMDFHRRAVGAQRRQVMALVVGEVMRMTAAGLGPGVAAALGLGRALQGFVYGVRPADPLALMMVATTFTAVALAAAVVPARRAGRVDPMAGLREP